MAKVQKQQGEWEKLPTIPWGGEYLLTDELFSDDQKIALYHTCTIDNCLQIILVFYPIILFIHSIHSFYSFIHSIQSFYPFILSIHHSFYPFILSIHSIHSFYPFILSIHSIHSFYPFILSIHSIHSFYPFILFIECKDCFVVVTRWFA